MINKKQTILILEIIKTSLFIKRLPALLKFLDALVIFITIFFPYAQYKLTVFCYTTVMINHTLIKSEVATEFIFY
ncbi:hypothetical protein DC498_24035 [Terrimonas sp.]|nr:hypothetical protein DC498_24035 [Terrimonas sp.]